MFFTEFERKWPICAIEYLIDVKRWRGNCGNNSLQYRTVMYSGIEKSVDQLIWNSLHFAAHTYAYTDSNQVASNPMKRSRKWHTLSIVFFCFLPNSDRVKRAQVIYIKIAEIFFHWSYAVDLSTYILVIVAAFHFFSFHFNNSFCWSMHEREQMSAHDRWRRWN